MASALVYFLHYHGNRCFTDPLSLSSTHCLVSSSLPALVFLFTYFIIYFYLFAFLTVSVDLCSLLRFSFARPQEVVEAPSSNLVAPKAHQVKSGPQRGRESLSSLLVDKSFSFTEETFSFKWQHLLDCVFILHSIVNIIISCLHLNLFL